MSVVNEGWRGVDAQIRPMNYTIIGFATFYYAAERVDGAKLFASDPIVLIIAPVSSRVDEPARGLSPSPLAQCPLLFNGFLPGKFRLMAAPERADRTAR